MVLLWWDDFIALLLSLGTFFLVFFVVLGVILGAPGYLGLIFGSIQHRICYNVGIVVKKCARMGGFWLPLGIFGAPLDSIWEPFGSTILQIVA